MKLILAVIQDYDVDTVLRALTSRGFRVTRMSAAGGFLNSPNTVLLTGIDDSDLTRCLEIIDENSRMRELNESLFSEIGALGLTDGDIAPVPLGGSVALVLDIDRFERIYPSAD